MISDTHAAMLRRAESVPLYSGSRLTERHIALLVERGLLAPTERRFIFAITESGRAALREFEEAHPRPGLPIRRAGEMKTSV